MSIASAIQEKQQQVQEAYTVVANKGGTLPSVKNLTNLASAIESISSGSGSLISRNITENGRYRASSFGADGFSEVNVNVQADADLITTTITTNGTYDARNYAADGFSSVEVDVPLSILIDFTVTENGTYDAGDEEANGFSSVEVNVNPPLVDKTISVNGTYTASIDDNAYGYNTVTVNTPYLEYQGYLNAIKQVLSDAEIPFSGNYSDLASTIRSHIV